MPTKTSKTKAPAKTATKKVVAKAKPVAKKATAKVKAKLAARPVAKKAAPRTKAGKKKSTPLLQSVKEGVQTGLHAVTDLVKKVTPEVLLPHSSNGKARRKK